MKPLLIIKNLNKEYFINNPVLQGINLELKNGDFACLMGASGCGKSTLLNIISTIDKPTSGEVIINDYSICNLDENELSLFRKQHLGFIFQDYNLLDTLTIYENIALAMTGKGVDKNKVKNIVLSTANKLGIIDILDKFPYEVSGGQCQRTACARAICTKPTLILADEPTGALDSNSSKSFMKMLKNINDQDNTTILMVTHDALSASYADQIFFMKDGKIIANIQNSKNDNQVFFIEILNMMLNIEATNYVS